VDVLLLKTLRWIFGYACFKVSGGYPEKFINLSVKENIRLWDLKKESGNLHGKVIASEYKFLRKMARKANSHIRVKQKCGLPFFMSRYKKRIGFLVGGLIFVAILGFFSMYIWSVKVVGNDTIPTQEILKAMEEVGVSPGSLKRRINAPMAEQMSMAKLDNVAWMSLNISGSCANILIKEKVKTPEIFSVGEPCNVISCEDGQIERLETYNGIPMVAVGDVVTKGQLLISGVSESADSKNLFLDADGKVFAKVRRKIREAVKLRRLEAVDTGKIVRKYRIKICGLEIPIGYWYKTDDRFRSEISVNSPKIFGAELPVEIFKEEHYEQECGEIVLTPEEAKAEAGRKISEREQSELKEAHVLERTENAGEENGEYVVEVNITCIDNIGKKERISFD
jgi:similar to stage IV sporulation protein